ncbi:MAG: MFS transporter, partial [Acidobacteria bacterium]|nr:MFS transporter [Acidobacteriota bacterium]
MSPTVFFVGLAFFFFVVWAIADVLQHPKVDAGKRKLFLTLLALGPVGVVLFLVLPNFNGMITLGLCGVSALAAAGYAATKPARDIPFRGSWMIAASFITFGLSTGFPYYNISFFFDYFRDDHGWTQELVTTGAPIAVLLTIWAGPIIVPRFSPRWLILIGTGFTFAAFEWFGRLGGSDVEYYAAWCFYMLGYFISGPIPHQIIISNWYKEQRGFAMGITYVGVAIVGAMANKVGPALATQMDYTEALKIMGFFLLAAWPLALFVLKDKPEAVGELPDGKVSKAAVERDKPAERPRTAAGSEAKSFGFLMSKAPFWLLLVGSAASIGSIAAVNFLMKFVFEEQGFVDQAARDAIWSKASIAVLLSSIFGRLLAGYLADTLPRKWVMLATYAIVAAAIPSLFLVTPETPNMVYLFAVVFGFAMGADYMLIPLMAADQFGLATLPKAMSAILPSDTI